ncbi:putative tail fiber protein [Erwinia phage Papaline]|nr:putative tail fiber protein [Erwinia phage Papaline]
MTNRVGFISNIWAENGVATDPDLDTTHPIYQPGKYAKGWIFEKEPHQWQNFLYQTSDLKNQIIASEQFPEWDVALTYSINAVIRKGDDFYVNVSGVALKGKDPATDAGWSKLIGVDADAVNTAEQTLNTKIMNHLNADNPHNDNIHSIGGYEKQEIDDFLGSPTDPRTIIYHENIVGKSAHSETPAQVGTLPVGGGTFTGDVAYDGGVMIGPGSFQQDGPDLKMSNAGGSIIMEAGGNAIYGEDSTGSRNEITTVANFQRQQRAVNYMFSLPQSIADVDFRAGSLSSMGTGTYTIDGGTKAPKMSAKGWEIEAGFLITGMEFNIPRTDLIEYYAGDVFRRILVESTVPLVGAQDLKDIMTRIAPDATHVQRIVVWPSLNKYQKSTLLPTYASLFLQNDTSNSPGTAWYVSKIDTNIFEMPNATAPKGSQYIGAFQMSANGVRGARIDGTAVWTTSDDTVVKIGSVSNSGQAVVSILKAGTAVLVCKWGGMAAKVTITAV